MKKLLTLCTLLCAVCLQAQQNAVPASLKDALYQAKLFTDTQLKPSLGPGLDYYSKHYEDIFGKYLYTFDPGKSGARYIYLNDSRYLFSGSNGFALQMPIAGSAVQLLSPDYNSLEFINVLSSLLGGEKIDFTIKVK
jgi:hypothetical protein